MLSSMIFIPFSSTAKQAVSESALELQSVLIRARSLALKTGKMHAVSFHIENAGDGSVLRNRFPDDDYPENGGHWYCIIGPDNQDSGKRSVDYPPLAYFDKSNHILSFFALSDYIQSMKNAQVGERHYLRPGTRFLALTDVDELYSASGFSSTTYPRPWFGFYDDTTGILYPWGGYNQEIDISLPFANSGLHYEGIDGTIPYDVDLDTNINPSQVWGRVHLEATAHNSAFLALVEDRTFEKYFGNSRGYLGPDQSMLASVAGNKVVRPLVNALWGDLMIMFDATGAAHLSVAHGRSVFFGAGGTSADIVSGREYMLINNVEEITGGFYISICRDVDVEDPKYKIDSATGRVAYNRFDSAEDAFESIFPLKRVFIDRNSGLSEVRSDNRVDCNITAEDLKQHSPYPRID
ncbi:MAG: hypothetical protein HRU15_09245 [Planctomycetes bacterium]|nr:hypothetical protein [Planctomycetota bacterium]